MLLTTGLRIAEVLNLTGATIRTALREGSVIILQKGGTERLISFPTGTMYKQAIVLADDLEDTQTVEHLLHSHRRLTRKGVEDYVRRELQRLAAGVGIEGKVGPHVGRRTVGDAIYEQDHDMRAVAEALGNEPRTAAKWYQDHVRPRAGAKALGAAVGEEKDDGKES